VYGLPTVPTVAIYLVEEFDTTPILGKLNHGDSTNDLGTLAKQLQDSVLPPSNNTHAYQRKRKTDEKELL